MITFEKNTIINIQNHSSKPSQGDIYFTLVVTAVGHKTRRNCTNHAKETEHKRFAIPNKHAKLAHTRITKRIENRALLNRVDQKKLILGYFDTLAGCKANGEN